MTRQKKNQQRECFDISEVINNLDQAVLNYVLFTHAFTGCDTSAIHRFGKTAIYKKLRNLTELKKIADTFYEDDQLSDDIGKASIQFFETLNSPCHKLPQIKKKRYDEMVMSSRLNTDPALFPLSPRAEFFHGLRVYNQLKVWQSLSDTDAKPLKWGWEIKDGLFMPIMTDEPQAHTIYYE